MFHVSTLSKTHTESINIILHLTSSSFQSIYADYTLSNIGTEMDGVDGKHAIPASTKVAIGADHVTARTCVILLNCCNSCHTQGHREVFNAV